MAGFVPANEVGRVAALGGATAAYGREKLMRRIRARFGPTLAAIAAAAASIPGSAALAASVTSPLYPGVVCEEVQVPMRDGTLLTTDVYQPSAAGRYPVVMQRDPYGRSFGNGCFAGLSVSVASFAQQG